jgi:hypothetical protein
MEQKDYVLTAISMVLAALVPILVAYGVLTQENADLWVNLLMAIAALIVPVVITQTAQNWTRTKANIRVAELQAGIR